MTPSPCGWEEAFETSGALTQARITWSLSPMVPQVLGINPGSPCAHGVAGTRHGEVRDRLWKSCYIAWMEYDWMTDSVVDMRDPAYKRNEYGLLLANFSYVVEYLHDIFVLLFHIQ